MNFERRQVFVMLTLAVVVILIVDHWKISCLTPLIAFDQFISRCSRFPVSVIPRSQKGEFSIKSSGGSDLQVVRGITKQCIFGFGDICGEARECFEFI